MSDLVWCRKVCIPLSIEPVTEILPHVCINLLKFVFVSHKSKKKCSYVLFAPNHLIHRCWSPRSWVFIPVVSLLVKCTGLNITLTAGNPSYCWSNKWMHEGPLLGGLIYTRGQVTSDTSPPALVGQDTKPRLGERAGHLAVFRAGSDGRTLT